MTEIERLKAIVEQLRSPDGCPWDKAQTHESLKPECIEEAAEVICGINILSETGDADNLKEELGDLLFAITNVSRFLDIDPEDALNATTQKFMTRFSHVEESASRKGLRLEDMTLAEMDVLWEEAKKIK